MYGFEQFEFELTMQNVLNRVSDIVLWRYYLGVDFQIGKTICSPLRRETRPSFSIYYSMSGKLMFKDFGTGDYGDIINYVQLAHSTGFWGALEKINKDFRLGLGTDFSPSKIEIPKKSLIAFEKKFMNEKGNTPLFQISTREYGIEDITYWQSFGINGGTIDRYDVYAINNLYIDKKLAYTYDVLNPGYAYYFPKTGHMKCYFPFSKVRRFMGNVNNYEDIQGYWQCDVKREGRKLLILTKSLKDCMLLRELGYSHAMAINGEGHYFYVDFIRHIKKYYHRIVSLYDPDKAGIKGAKFLWKEYGIVPLFIPRYYRGHCKDISDICKVYSKEEAEEVMKIILNRVYNLQMFQ